ncbi:hypothetical protein GCM10028787_10780 [Brachybacterium horti]
MPHTSVTPAKYAASLRTATADDFDPLAYEYTRTEEEVQQWQSEHHTTPADELPFAASDLDTIERTVPLDGGTAHVEHYADRTEVTIRLDGRTVLGFVLSPVEAFDLGNVLAQPRGCDGEATVADLFRVADHLGVEASDLLAMRRDAA